MINIYASPEGATENKANVMSPLQGSGKREAPKPRALPWAEVFLPFRQIHSHIRALIPTRAWGQIATAPYRAISLKSTQGDALGYILSPRCGFS